MSRSRPSTARAVADIDNGEVVASAGGAAGSAGAIASEAWLRARGGRPPTEGRWHVEITLDVTEGPPADEIDEATATRFHIDIYAEEWGVFFCHGGRSSWIRVTEVPIVHGRDDHHLLAHVPALEDIGALLRRLEMQHAIHFNREDAEIRSNLPSVVPAIRSWVLSL